MLLGGAARTVKTTRPGLGNISLSHFSATPLTFTASENRSPAENHYRTHDFRKVSGDWKAKGESVVVTAIYPRETPEKDLRELKSISQAGAAGFSAVTPDGTQVQYVAAEVIGRRPTLLESRRQPAEW